MTGRPNLAVTGFSAFPGAPVNPTEALVQALKDDPGDLTHRCHFQVRVLDVDYATIDSQLASLADRSGPDIAIHFGLAADATGFRLERYGRNRSDTERVDNCGHRPNAQIVQGGDDAHESTLPRDDIASGLAAAGLPVTLDDQAGDYLCNAVLYLSRAGCCGEFQPAMSGFIHVPQLPETDGGIAGPGRRLSLTDLVVGARLICSICLDRWHEKRAGDFSPAHE